MLKSCNELSEEAKELHVEYSKNGIELNRLTSLSYEEKLEESKKAIQEALKNSKKPVVSCSFGKDSIMLLHLVHLFDPGVPAVFNDTGIEFKETYQYKEQLKKEWDLNVIELKPERTFWQIVDEYGFPKSSRNSKTGDKREPKCCKILKRDPMLKFIKEYRPDLNFVGLTSGEGRSRRLAFIRSGSPTYYSKSEGLYKSNPLIWWMPDGVFEYFKRENIPLNPAYEKYKIDRIGCLPCTGYIGWQEQLARIAPRTYQRVQHDQGQRLISDLSVD